MIQPRWGRLLAQCQVLIPLTVGEVIQPYKEGARIMNHVLIPLTVGEVIQLWLTSYSTLFGCLNPLNSRGSDSTTWRELVVESCKAS